MKRLLLIRILLCAAVLSCAIAARPDVLTTKPASNPPDRTLLDWYFAGGMFMHPIALCSMLGVALIIERLISVRRSAVAPSRFVNGLIAAMGPTRDIHEGLKYCSNDFSPLARIIASGLRKSTRGTAVVEKQIEEAGTLVISRLRRNMRFLYSIASIAMLLGLIGTIQGMIQAFQAAEVAGTGRFAPLAKGIYTALITTFAGLLVAIPVTVFYYYFSGRIERITIALNEEAGRFMEYFDSAPRPQ